MCLVFMDYRIRGNDRKRLYGEFLEVPFSFRFCSCHPALFTDQPTPAAHHRRLNPATTPIATFEVFMSAFIILPLRHYSITRLSA